jgi:hypothetical protein
MILGLIKDQISLKPEDINDATAPDFIWYTQDFRDVHL